MKTCPTPQVLRLNCVSFLINLRARLFSSFRRRGGTQVEEEAELDWYYCVYFEGQKTGQSC